MNYDMILQEAHLAGQKALDECEVPMYKWSARTTPLGEKYDFENEPYELHGECGCAWIITREHGAQAFVKYLKKRYNDPNKEYWESQPVQKGVYGGWEVPTPDMDLGKYDQEVVPKYAYCKAYAKVLNDYGIKACAYEYLT